jgi:hypothetical protein
MLIIFINLKNVYDVTLDSTDIFCHLIRPFAATIAEMHLTNVIAYANITWRYGTVFVHE